MTATLNSAIFPPQWEHWFIYVDLVVCFLNLLEKASNFNH